MIRPQLEALLQNGKASNGGAPDFMIAVPPDEMSAALTILKHLEANGILTGFHPCDPPMPEGCIDIIGYIGP